MTEEQMEPTIQYQFLTGETWIDWKQAYEDALKNWSGLRNRRMTNENMTREQAIQDLEELEGDAKLVWITRRFRGWEVEIYKTHSNWGGWSKTYGPFNYRWAARMTAWFYG